MVHLTIRQQINKLRETFSPFSSTHCVLCNKKELENNINQEVEQKEEQKRLREQKKKQQQQKRQHKKSKSKREKNIRKYNDLISLPLPVI